MVRNLLGILLILAAIGVAVFWTNPLWISVQELRGEKAELVGAIQRFQELKKVRDDLFQTYNSISPSDLSRLEEFLPKSENIGLLLVNMEKLSQDNKMLLKQINVENAENKAGVSASIAGLPGTAGFSKIPVTLSVSGSYDSFRFFLGALEKNLRLIDVDTISFNASEKGTYDFSVSAVAYWYKR